jgi:hypothetical protein
MRYRPLHIPIEAFDRLIEHLDFYQGPELKRARFYGRAMVRMENLRSYFNLAFHFDSIKDFNDNEDILSLNLLNFEKRVAFDNDVTLARKEFEGENLLQLIITDKTGIAKLNYCMLPDTQNFYLTSPGYISNPLRGANVGNRIRIYDARYAGPNKLRIPHEWMVKNDDHYERTRPAREEFLKARALRV